MCMYPCTIALTVAYEFMCVCIRAQLHSLLHMNLNVYVSDIHFHKHLHANKHAQITGYIAQKQDAVSMKRCVHMDMHTLMLINIHISSQNNYI